MSSANEAPLISNPHGHMYVNTKYPGWTDEQAATARKNARVGNRKSNGGSREEFQKAVRRNLVFSIPEMAKYDYSGFSGENKTREQILASTKLLQTELELAESLQKEWRTVDRLPKDYYSMDTIWHHMSHFGATNRAQVDTILSVIQELIRDLYIEIGKIDAEEQSFN